MKQAIPNLSDVSPELRDLVEKFCLQVLSEAENRRLNELLGNDTHAQSFFLAYAGIHAQLSREYGPQADPATATPRPMQEEPEPVILPLRPRGRSSFVWAAGAAAAVLALAVGAVLLLSRPRPEHRMATNPPATRPATALATVTGTLGAQIASPEPRIETGRSLGPGRIHLNAGAVEVVLNNGVKILFEGPGELELQTSMRAFLHSGQAVVHVPANATGFVLETATADVVDLGTEFGVKAVPGGSTDIQVYQGSVITTAKHLGATTRPSQRLEAGKAVRIGADSGANAQRIDYSPQRFVRQLPDPKNRGSDWALPYNTSRLDGMRIMVAPAKVVIDGDLSEWNRDGSFRAQCDPPYGKDYHLEGAMMYDSEFLYIAARVGDPAPMRSVINPATDGDRGWMGGGIQVRLSTDRSLRWPVDADTPEYKGGPVRTRPQDLNEKLIHLTLWHYAPANQACLHLSYGMDFHGGKTNPEHVRGAFRKDADGAGYSLEYAIPWSLLNAGSNSPRAGDELAVNWIAHWSDQSGRLWRGQLVEIRNPAIEARLGTWEKAATWGRASYR